MQPFSFSKSKISVREWSIVPLWLRLLHVSSRQAPWAQEHHFTCRCPWCSPSVFEFIVLFETEWWLSVKYNLLTKNCVRACVRARARARVCSCSTWIQYSCQLQVLALYSSQQWLTHYASSDGTRLDSAGRDWLMTESIMWPLWSTLWSSELPQMDLSIKSILYWKQKSHPLRLFSSSPA